MKFKLVEKSLVSGGMAVAGLLVASYHPVNIHAAGRICAVGLECDDYFSGGSCIMQGIAGIVYNPDDPSTYYCSCAVQGQDPYPTWDCAC